MKRMGRKIMRKVARWILSYDRCPVDCRKDYASMGAMMLKLIALALVFIVACCVLIAISA